MKIPVSERSLVQRLHRAVPADTKLKCIRSPRLQERFGRWVLVNEKGVIQPNINLEQLAFKLGAINYWEELEKA